jgi:quercetin dioxygenase-like cupin family protein
MMAIDARRGSAMVRLLFVVAAVLLPLGHGAVAQTKQPATDIIKPLTENDKVRVYQANFKPGAKLAPRSFPNHLIYMVTDGTLAFVPEGRTGYEMSFKAGEAQWFPPQTRGIENDSDQEVKLLIVEVKEGTVVSRRAKVRRKRKR